MVSMWNEYVDRQYWNDNIPILRPQDLDLSIKILSSLSNFPEPCHGHVRTIQVEAWKEETGGAKTLPTPSPRPDAEDSIAGVLMDRARDGYTTRDWILFGGNITLTLILNPPRVYCGSVGHPGVCLHLHLHLHLLLHRGGRHLYCLARRPFHDTKLSI